MMPALKRYSEGLELRRRKLLGEGSSWSIRLPNPQ